MMIILILSLTTLLAYSNQQVVALEESVTALLVIDVQECFLPGGSLEVPADHIIPKINSLMEEKSSLFDQVIYSRDFHPDGHISFASTHGLAPFSHMEGKGGLPLTCIRPPIGSSIEGIAEGSAACCPSEYIDNSLVDCETQLCTPDGFDYEQESTITADNPACLTCAENPETCFDTTQMMWTDHCLQDGDSILATNLIIPEGSTVVNKGTNKFVDAYSAFADNTKTIKTELDQTLVDLGVTDLYVVGVAADVCVKATVLDALDTAVTKGYNVNVITDCTEAVLGDAVNKAAAEKEMEEAGATLMTAEDLLGGDVISSESVASLIETLVCSLFNQYC